MITNSKDFMNFDNTQTKRYLVKKIEREKKALTKNAASFAASALVVGLGVLGVAVFGEDLMQEFTSHSELTYGAYMHVRFQETLFALPLAGVVGGVVWSIVNARQTIKSFKTLKQDKRSLNQYEEEEEISDKKIR